MEPWTVILSFWITTWFMLVWRTYSISIRIISRRAEGQIIMEHRILHFILYTLGLVILTPFIWQVAIFEESRKAWVKAYVKAIIGIKK